MGENAGIVFCCGAEKGELINTGPNDGCDCSCSCAVKTIKYEPHSCLYFPGTCGDHPYELGKTWAIAARNTGSESRGSTPSASTKVTADLYQGSGDVYGVMTVGGRQLLRVLNGALDMRWFLNEGFASDSFAKYPASGAAQFDPAGKGGTFGFLHWLKRVNGFPTNRRNQFYSGRGGITRDMVSSDTDTPYDAGNPNQFNTVATPYFKYDAQHQTYFWYNDGDLGTENPFYVSKVRDSLGYSLYYNYQSNQLVNINGDIGQLAPYFGYDAGNRIDRIYLFDRNGSDHRATYYYYDANGALTTIVDPIGGVTYFSIDTATGVSTGYKVNVEVDPFGAVTYLTYDSANNYILLRLQQAGRTTYFADDGRSTNSRSASRLALGRASRAFRRTPFGAHNFGVTEQNVGGSATYYEYTSDRNQVLYEADPNGQKTFYEYNAKNFKTKVSTPDGGTAYFGYDSSGVNVVAQTGLRDTAANPQVTYFGYLSADSGRRTQILDPLKQAVYFGYDATNRLIKTLDARGGATYYHFDSYNQNDATLDALNNTAYFAYNANGQKTRVMDALNHTTYFGYDKLDQPISTLAPTGEATYYELDKRGQTIREGRPGGRATYFAYDAFRRTAATARLASTGLLATYFGYDDEDNTTTVVDPRQNVTYFGYDFRKKQIQSQDALGNTSYFVFDPAGNLTNTIDARGTWSLNEYDSVNELSKSVRGVAGQRPPRIASVMAHWNLNELSGTRADDAGNANTLNPNGTGGVDSGAGIIGNAASFVKANNQFLNAASSSSLSPSQDLTLSAWVNLSSLPAQPAAGSYTIRPVAAKWSDPSNRCYSFCVVRDGNGDVGIMLLISTIGSSASFAYAVPIVEFDLNQWRHVAASFDDAGGRMKLYVDGVLLYETTTSRTGIFTNAIDFTVGANATMAAFSIFTPEYFDGLIDELCLYDQVLTQAEISRLAQQHMEITFAAEPSDLLGTYFAYDLDGNRTTVVNERNFTSYFGYDLINRLVQARDALGNATYFGYDANNNQTKTLNPRAYATYFGFDALSRQTQMLDAEARATYFGYDSVGNLVKALYPGVQTEYWGYDASNRLVQQLDRGGYSTYFGFDLAGNQDRVLNARRFAAYFQFDLLDRVTAILNPLQDSAYFGYDSNSNTNSLVGTRWKELTAGSSTSYFGYDSLDRLVRQQDPLNRATYFQYDPVGNQSSISLPGNPLQTSYFGYDKFNRLVQVLKPTTDASYFGYDAASNVVQTLNARQFTSYFGYDALNRFSQSLNASNGSTYFGYDANGNLTRAVGIRWQESSPANFTSYFGYDALDRLIQQLDPVNRAAYFQYDVAGNQSGITLPGNPLQTTYFGYDRLNRLIQVLTPTNDSSYFGYDSTSNLVQALNARGFATYFGYDALNRGAQAQNALSGSTYFGYDAAGNITRLVGIRWPEATPAAFTSYFGYDAVGQLIKGLSTTGSATYFGYDPSGNIVQSLNARGFATYFGYDALNRGSQALNALNGSTYFGYDGNSNLTRLVGIRWKESTPANFAAYFGYDALDRLVQLQDPLSRSAYFQYDAAGNQCVIALPGNTLQVAYFGYDRINRLTQVLTPINSATYFGFDQAGNVAQVLNARGFSTYFGFDAMNRGVQALNALTGSTYFAYDANGNLARMVGIRWKESAPSSFTSYFTYDALDRLGQATDALGNVTQWGYDAAGNLTALKPAVGGTAYFYYDSRNLLTRAVDGAGDETLFAFDEVGNRTILVTGGAGYGTQAYGTTPYGGGASNAAYFGYDALNRLAKVLDAEGGTAYFGYDAGGNTVQALDALARATYFGYDKIDRLTTVLDALSQAVYFGYDQAGNRNAEMDALGRSTYYQYDVGNRLAAVLDPLNKAAYYGYDANSNLAQTLDNNLTAVYFGYDALDRRTAIQYPAETQYFGYDAAGNPVQAKDAWGASYFGYDALSRLVQRKTPRSDTVYYGYDGVSNLLKLQYPQGASTCYYGYDAAQRLSQLLSTTGYSCYYTYDTANDVTQRTMGNGVVSYATFDRANRMVSLRYAKSDGASLAYFDYNRDVAGRITRIQRENGLAIYYSFDNIDRLAAETWRKTSDNSQIYAFTYSYDAASNRLQQRRETTSGTELDSTYYSYAADNSLTRRQVRTPPSTVVDTYYYYDANGAMTTLVEGGSPTYFGYGANQLITAVKPPSEAATYFYYDGLMKRYLIDKAGDQTYYLWDGLSLLETRNHKTIPFPYDQVQRYAYGHSRIGGIGNVVERHGEGGSTVTVFPLADHRGTVFMTTEINQAPSGSQAVIDAFGRPLATAYGEPDFGYQSNWLTMQVGGRWLCFSPVRVYDPELGIFLQRDFLPFLNKYIAFDQDPVDVVDPLGLETEEECKENCNILYRPGGRAAQKELDRCLKNCECLYGESGSGKKQPGFADGVNQGLSIGGGTGGVGARQYLMALGFGKGGADNPKGGGGKQPPQPPKPPPPPTPESPKDLIALGFGKDPAGSPPASAAVSDITSQESVPGRNDLQIRGLSLSDDLRVDLSPVIKSPTKTEILDRAWKNSKWTDLLWIHTGSAQQRYLEAAGQLYSERGNWVAGGILKTSSSLAPNEMIYSVYNQAKYQAEKDQADIQKVGGFRWAFWHSFEMIPPFKPGVYLYESAFGEDWVNKEGLGPTTRIEKGSAFVQEGANVVLLYGGIRLEFPVTQGKGLNLFSGNTKVPGFLNVDTRIAEIDVVTGKARPLPTDIIADVRNLRQAFPEGTLFDKAVTLNPGEQAVNSSVAKLLKPGAELSVSASPYNKFAFRVIGKKKLGQTVPIERLRPALSASEIDAAGFRSKEVVKGVDPVFGEGAGFRTTGGAISPKHHYTVIYVVKDPHTGVLYAITVLVAADEAQAGRH